MYSKELGPTGNEQTDNDLKNPNSLLSKTLLADKIRIEEDEIRLLDTIILLQQKKIKADLDQLAQELREDAIKEKKKQENFQADAKQTKENELKALQYYEKQGRPITLIDKIRSDITNLINDYNECMKEIKAEHKKVDVEWTKGESKNAKIITEILNELPPIQLDKGELKVNFSKEEIAELQKKLESHAPLHQIEKVVQRDIAAEQGANMAEVGRKLDLMTTLKENLQRNCPKMIEDYGFLRLWVTYEHNEALQLAFALWTENIQKNAQDYKNVDLKQAEFFQKNEARFVSIKDGVSELRKKGSNGSLNKLDDAFKDFAANLEKAYLADKARIGRTLSPSRSKPVMKKSTLEKVNPENKNPSHKLR